MARMKVSITGAGDDGFIVRWTVGRSARPAGIVAVRTRNQAEALKENLEAGIAAVSAIHMALMWRPSAATRGRRACRRNGAARLPGRRHWRGTRRRQSSRPRLAKRSSAAPTS